MAYSTARPEVPWTTLVPVTDPLDIVLDELAAARDRLNEARLRQIGRNSPRHRAAVAERLAQIDALLDVYLQVRSRRR
ncbi:hypothetical protein GCM10009609_32750 [Pseudonocardia aurantiaca]